MPATVAAQTEALEIFRALGDAQGAARALVDLGRPVLNPLVAA